MVRSVKELIEELQNLIDNGTTRGDENLLIPALIRTSTYHNLQDNLMIDLCRSRQGKVLIYGIKDII